MDRARRAGLLNNKRNAYEFALRQERLKKRLRKVKSCLDNKPPVKPKHLTKNKKREQAMEEKYAKIEKENRLLLEKMSWIMRKSGLDNKNKHKKFGRSLNRDLRKRELARITMENRAILQRIQSRQPTYSHVKWDRERKINERYKKNIAEYPLVDFAEPTELKSTTTGYFSRASLPEMDPEDRERREHMTFEDDLSATMPELPRGKHQPLSPI